MYYGKFDTSYKDEFVFSSVKRYNNIGMFVDEYEDLPLLFKQIAFLVYKN